MTQTPFEVSEHPVFQAWFWKAQRMGWLGLGLFVGLALLGLTGGGGPFAEKIQKSGSLQVILPRVLRADSTVDLQLVLPSGPQAEVVLDRAFLQAFDFSEPIPFTPHRMTDRGLVLQLPARTAVETIFRISISPRVVGRVTAAVQAAGDRVVLQRLILP